MIWDDIGFLLNKNRYNENSLISEIYTKNFGKVSGIIFGGTSKKIKNYLQIGNKLYVNYNSKNENSMGYFKVEIQEALSPLYFDNHQKLTCISSARNLVNEKIIGDQKQYISKSSTEKRIIPNFLIDKNNSTEDIGSLLTGLKLLSDYLEKSILKPNNLNQPISRLQFINTLK